MPESCTIHVNGKPLAVARDQCLLVALMNGGHDVVRRSVSGSLRGPLCGMGVCFECRVTVDGVNHVKACQCACRDGMCITLPEVAP
jgi:D-hydroxyproline dehydrogenase subunit gamma